MSRDGKQPAETTFDVSWNLLNDEDTHRNPLQKDRLHSAAQQLLELNSGSGPDVMFMCEGISPHTMHSLADRLALEVIGQPQRYSPEDVMAFAVRPELAQQVQVEFIACGKKKRSHTHGFLMMTLAGITRIGIHQPHRMRRDEEKRRITIEKAIGLTEALPQVIIEGDFNAQPDFNTRQRLVKAGFVDMFKGGYPEYPNPGFEKTGALRYVPKAIRKRLHLSFDGMYVKGMNNTKAGWEKSDVSDHPLIHLTHTGNSKNH